MMTPILYKFFCQLERCAKVEETAISPWITNYDMGHWILSKEEIVEVCLSSQPAADDSSNDDNFNIQEAAGPSCSEAIRMLDELITCFEKQHETSSIVKLLTLRCL